MREKISTAKAPAAIGAYSQAILSNNLIFSSGQLPINPETGEMVESDIRKQTKQSLDNLKFILAEANSDCDHILKTTIFLSDLNNFSEVNKIYSEYFEGDPPARSCIEVAKLPKDSLIEIEAIALSQE
ncbi:RidA family protein [Halanaerobium praevalens]|uniref:Endoribonuclease L-PSP n=1 Tax=Halanaerobium praevalens (strain ATCC 33744 / DSM 2228 / GSL) TaxID=572479 RepID=E3DR43_HALPG|nr:RidA family protein [Halanaerobium praevalens]ADO78032.1 endoribonuclease L-PSP [Halanaerobium praevalens DSM 2228]